MNSGKVRRVRSLLILALDVVAAISIFSSVFFLRLKRLPDYSSLELWLIVSTLLLTLFLSGTYFKERSTTLPTLPIRTFFICLVGGGICILWVYLLGPTKFNEYFGRGVLPAGTIIFGVVTTLIRFLVNRIHHLQERETELLYIGYSKSGKAFLQELRNHAEVRAITIASSSEVITNSERVSTTYLDDQNAFIDRNNWSGIIVDPEHHSDADQTALLVSQRLTGTPVLSLEEYYERNWFMVPVNHIGDDWFLRSQGFSMLGNPISLRIKRLIDIILSFFGLLISIPLVLVCALFIKLSSKGPIFFNQKRVGYQGEQFSIVKLRTMHVEAEKDGAQWAQKNDPRVTPIGSILRKSRLDELPQFWNVLRGDMSFVGPRPERPEFTSELALEIPYYDLRHIVKPGITGWAQVIFPYGASVEDSLRKLQYELYYIKNQSLLLDLNIMLRTLITVFQRAGR